MKKHIHNTIVLRKINECKTLTSMQVKEQDDKPLYRLRVLSSKCQEGVLTRRKHHKAKLEPQLKLARQKSVEPVWCIDHDSE